MLAKVISCYVYSGFKRLVCVFVFVFLQRFLVIFGAFFGLNFFMTYVVVFENCVFLGCLPFKRSVF